MLSMGPVPAESPDHHKHIAPVHNVTVNASGAGSNHMQISLIVRVIESFPMKWNPG